MRPLVEIKVRTTQAFRTDNIKMFVQTALLCLIFGIFSKPIEALECYSCAGSTKIPDCTQSVTCPYGSTCFSEYITGHGGGRYTLGCKPSLSCSTATTPVIGAVSLVGRSAPTQGNCSQCCNTKNCNRQLCQYEDPTCRDDTSYGCDVTSTHFEICNDKSSKVHCRRFCGYCNTVDGVWSAWSTWSSCDVTCGQGRKSRHRTCSNSAPQNGGDDCHGDSVVYGNCTLYACPVPGGWSQWSQWGSCSSTCDFGLQRRDRSCSSPYPAHCGDTCYGESRDDRLCFPGACANGGWSQWESWGTCSVTCGGGVVSRSRRCDSPVPSMAGTYCTGGPDQSDSCNTSPCQVNGDWSKWGAWSTCSLTCGSGVTTRFRRCDSPAPSSTGRDCTGDPMEADSCHVSRCPVNAVGFTVKYPREGHPSNQMAFHTVVTNEGGAFKANTGVFTCPVAGYYYFNAALLKDYSHDDAAGCHIDKNGSFLVIAYTRPEPPPRVGGYAAVTGVYTRLAVNDTVTLGSCTPPIETVFHSLSSFSGFLITPDAG